MQYNHKLKQLNFLILLIGVITCASVFTACENFIFGANIREQLFEDVGCTYSFYEYPNDSSAHIEKTFIIGKDITESDFPSYEHEDTLLVGWQYYKNLDSGFTAIPDNFSFNEKNYISSIRVSPQQECLVAVWKKKCTVTFVTNCDIEIEPAILPEGDLLEEPEMDYKRGQFRFTGWYTDREFTQSYDFNTVVTGDFTLYARWIEVYTIFYWEDEDSDWAWECDIEKNHTAYAEDCPFAPPEGYGFLGWSLSPGGSLKYKHGDAITTKNINLNLYPVWTSDTVTITYIDKSGTFSARTATYGRGAAITVGRVLNEDETWFDYLANVWTITGKDIRGFDVSASLSASQNTTFDRYGNYNNGNNTVNAYSVSTNTTFYTYWNEIVYRIWLYYTDANGQRQNFLPYDSNNGKWWHQEVTYNHKPTRPTPVPIVYGHTFEDWYEGTWLNNGNVAVSSTPYNFNTILNDDTMDNKRDIHLFAKFTLGGNSTGAISADITFTDIQDPNNIISSGPNVAAGNLQIIANNYDSYVWYLDNVQMPFNNVLFSIPVASLATGQHDITLIVSKVESGNTYFYSWFGQFTKS